MKRVIARIIHAREKSVHTVIDSELAPILTLRQALSRETVSHIK